MECLGDGLPPWVTPLRKSASIMAGPHEGGGGGGTFLGAGSLVGGGGGGTPSVRIQGWQAKDTDASPKDTLNAASAPFVPRARIREHRVVGLITEWRGYMGNLIEVRS